MGRGTVRCVECVQEWAQHTALGGASAECEWGEKMVAESHLLWSVGKEVFNPGAGGGGEV